MLEYGVAAIVTPIRKCHYILTKSIADSKLEWQSTKDDSQDELENYNRDCEVIENEKNRILRRDIYWEGKFKRMEQEIRRTKKELEVLKSQNNATSCLVSFN